MTWQFTDPPDGIDLTAPLMPQRDASDMRRFGIDPCWLHEALSVWRGVLYGASGGKYAISKVPRAADHNRIRYLLPKGGSGFTKGRPPDGIISEAALESAIISSWGTVPPDVSPGDPVKREDVSAVYDYMRPVRGVLLHAVPATHQCVTAFRTEYYRPDWDGYSPAVLPTPSTDLYRYENDYTTGAWAWQSGWTRWTGTASSEMSDTLPGRRNAWVGGVSAWVKVSGSYLAEGVDVNKVCYVPVAVTAGWTDAGLHVAAHPPLSQVGAILAHFGWTEDDPNSSIFLYVAGMAVYLEIAAAYLVP